MAYSHEQYAPQQSITFHGLPPGVKFRARVRAVDGQGNFGSYSDPVDIISGIGSSAQPSNAVSGLVVSGYSLGVQASWNSEANARGYEVYVTKGSGTPIDPDPSNPDHLYYRGNATSLMIKASNGHTVKVKVLWYDQFGRKSTGIASGSGQALDEAGA